MTFSTTIAYTVRGMTCEHCKSSVAEEVGEIEGVERVEVNLASGRLEIQGVGISPEAVKVAVENAGYELAESASVVSGDHVTEQAEGEGVTDD
ncbi:hypothetical protein BH20ACT15_BH20ACT15_00570 [soil metagenome]